MPRGYAQWTGEHNASPNASQREGDRILVESEKFARSTYEPLLRMGEHGGTSSTF